MSKKMYAKDVIMMTKDGKIPEIMTKWHKAIELGFNDDHSAASEIFEDIFHKDMVFLPPTYIKARPKKFAIVALQGIAMLFKHDFRYTREMISDNDFALEFETSIDGRKLRGVDLIKVKDGKIIQFEVMMRDPQTTLKVLEFQTKFLGDLGVLPKKKAKL